MVLTERFRTAVADRYQQVDRCAELVPMVLAQACVAVLPVVGAGITLTDELRVPLGASDTTAARAETLQTTLGEGPCLTASGQDAPLVADLERIASTWPLFHRQFVAETPYGSIVSLPLSSPQSRLRFGALDLYLEEPDQVPDFFLDEVMTHIAVPVADLLFGRGSLAGPDAGPLPPWLNTDPVNRRMHVWVAVGMLIEFAGVDNSDALAALRAYAFSHDLTLDALADQMMSEQLEPESVLS